MTADQLRSAARLWHSGSDTWSIANALGLTEETIWNHLSALRRFPPG